MAELLAADAGSIARVKDAGDSVVAAIKIAQAVALRVLQAEASAQPVLANWQALIDYLTARLAHQTIESVRVLHLNTRNILIRDEEMSRGPIDESARSEENTSELQSLMRISYTVFSMKKKKSKHCTTQHEN